MSGGRARTFRRDTGLTEYQYATLRSMENGEMKRSKDLFGAPSLHRLVAKGILEYVHMQTGNYGDDIWRLTEQGRKLMAMLGDGQSPGEDQKNAEDHSC
jgi:hypothetical protein